MEILVKQDLQYMCNYLGWKMHIGSGIIRDFYISISDSLALSLYLTRHVVIYNNTSNIAAYKFTDIGLFL